MGGDWEAGARYRAGRRPRRAVLLRLPLAHRAHDARQQEAAAASVATAACKTLAPNTLESEAS